jgi:hypothetical protein
MGTAWGSLSRGPLHALTEAIEPNQGTGAICVMRLPRAVEAD